jgi:hypothetical protein
MKNIFLITVCLAFASGLFAQSSEYDNINVNEYYIVKKGSDLKSASVKKASDINNSSDTEKQFGTNFKSERRYAETQGIFYTYFEYNDGMTLYLPEYERMNIGFEIKSANYILKLSSGQSMRVGMKLDEIKSIFPKSYSKRFINENNDRIVIIVNFSGIVNGEFRVFDSSIVFIFNKEDGVLKEFYSHVPS